MKGLKVSLIGVPTNSAGKKSGVAKALAALRRAGLVQALGRSCQINGEGDMAVQKLTVERDACSGIIAYNSLASMIGGVRALASAAPYKRRQVPACGRRRLPSAARLPCCVR